MLGVAFITAIAAGLLIGLIPGGIGVITLLSFSVYRKQFRSILIYLVLVVLIEILLILAGNFIFNFGMGSAEELKASFYLYVYLGASPGISLLLGLTSLLIRPK